MAHANNDVHLAAPNTERVSRSSARIITLLVVPCMVVSSHNYIDAYTFASGEAVLHF